MAYMSLAITARNAGHLSEAGEAMRLALQAAQPLRMRAADRASLERTMAVIDYDLGRYAAARDRLVPLIARTADPAERALQLRILANVQVELGDAAQALASADAAITSLAGNPESAELPFARQARARALAATGRVDEALADIGAVSRALLASGRSPDSLELLRATRYRAEFLLAAGRRSEALAALRELQRRHESTQSSPIEKGLTLELLASALGMEHPEEARLLQIAARAELSKQLQQGHPYLVHNERVNQ
jgi:hypothetical protein